MQNNCCNPNDNFHMNGFIDIDGFPYLLADYLDRRNFQQVDQSMIQSYVNIDQTESMRAIVDINFHDIGKNSNGSLGVVGNTTKQVNLLQLIRRNFIKLNRRLPVLRRGVIARISYRLENNKTGQIIRSTTEDFRISHSNFFVYINQQNLSDNALLSNFAGTSISTMNYFTYGNDPMILRIQDLSLHYEMVKVGIAEGNYSIHADVPFSNETDIFEYYRLNNNKTYQPHYGTTATDTVAPPQWNMLSPFYHFDNNGKDIILHTDEIYNNHTQTILVPIVSTTINQAVMINPAHRIIFKFNIWRNDVTMINNTTPVAHALDASIRNPQLDNYNPYFPGGLDSCYPNNNPTATDYKQNEVINQLALAVIDINKTLKELKKDTVEPNIPKLPETPPAPPNRDDVLGSIIELIAELSKKVDEINKKISSPSEPPSPKPHGDTGEMVSSELS